MKRMLLLTCLFGIFLVSGCSHQMHITNAEDYFSPPSPPLAKPIKLGVTSSNVTDAKNSRYVNAVIDALQRSGNFERVLYPFSQTVNQGQADVLLDIAVNPKYDGSGANFWISWPGFIIFAPAAWGYKYTAEIETRVSITDLKDKTSKQVAVPIHYIFRQADISRAWTEAGGWFFFSVPALIGGIVFTGYDDDVTNEFITKVSPNYGAYVSKKIVDALQSAPTATAMSLR
jgi:hypothetical protein